MTKEDLFDWIKRRLGHPMVRVELHESQIEDACNKAKDEFLKWAHGNATEDVSITLELSSGVSDYVLPAGITEIVKIKDFGIGAGGINTLFSTENILYNFGVYSFLDNPITGYSMVDYHLALEFMDLLDRYIPDRFNWRYNKSKNMLKLKPTPIFDPEARQYILLFTYMYTGADEDSTELSDDVFDAIWNEVWVQDYSLACAKETLGYIRRKFANFSSIGNTGISLDGDSLISEAQQEKEKLEERLRNEEEHAGWPIIIG